LPNQLRGRKVAFLATDGVEQVELTAPWNALKQAGAEVMLVSDKPGEIQAMNHEAKGEKLHVDVEVSAVTAQDFDALVLPGGVANPDRLRTNKEAVSFVREFMELDKPVAAICHGPWLLVEADAVRGRTINIVAEPGDRRQKRGRGVGGQAGARRSEAPHEPKARRSARFLRQAGGAAGRRH
jgi:protease I